MSTFDFLQSRITQSAKTVMGAARHLSSLDELARNDDYVHSEGLRLSGQKKKGGCNSIAETTDLSTAVENLSEKIVDDYSVAARNNHPREHCLLEEIKLYSAEKLPSKAEPPNAKTEKNSATPNMNLVQSVANTYQNDDALEQSINKSARVSSLQIRQIDCTTGKLSVEGQSQKMHSHFLQELEYESDSDSSDDEKQQLVKSQCDIEMAGSSSDGTAHVLHERPSANFVQKDVHRFLKMTNQLESERETLLQSQTSRPKVGKPMNGSNQIKIVTDGSSAGDDTHRAIRAGLTWIRNVASPQLEQFSKQLMSKISEPGVDCNDSNNMRKPMIGPRYHAHNTNNDNLHDEDKIIVSTSSAFLGAQDKAELERIRLRSLSSTRLRMLLQSCIDNPRMMFIAVTLAFALFTYFFSRHHSVDDVM